MADRIFIEKQYESLPAYEQIKTYVVQRLVQLSSEAAALQTLLFVKKRNKMLACTFKSDVLNFYQFLRPKLLQKKEYHGLCQTLDYFLYNPTKFTLSDAFATLTNLNQFCEDYKLTSTAIWSGQTKSDIYDA